MTDQREWASVFIVLDGGWPQDFTTDHEAAYLAVLRRFPVATVAQAVGDLAAAGAKFRPSVGEVAAECRRLTGDAPEEFDAPSWVEVLPVADRAAYRWLRNPPEAARFVREQLGDVAAAWFANGGREQILGANLGADPYAAKNAADIGKGYDTFVATQRTRAAKGLTVTTVDAHGGLVASKLAELGAGQ
jgi:hypothetical protein